MKIVRGLTYYIILGILASNVLAEQPSFINISVDQGLPGSNIRKIYQDNFGYIWIGFEATGLCRYDGKEFITFENNPEDPFSLSNNFIRDILSDKYNNLWIATENGLNYFNREKGEFYHVNPKLNTKKEINANWILSLNYDNDGDLWVCHTKGVYYISSDITNRLIPYKEKKTDFDFLNNFEVKNVFDKKYGKIVVLSVISAGKGKVWISTNKGLFLYDKKIEECKKYPLAEKQGGLIHDFIHFIRKYENDSYLVGTDRGLFVLYPEEDRFEPIKLGDIPNSQLNFNDYIDVVFDKKKRLWLGHSEGIVIGEEDNKGECKYSLIREGETLLPGKIIRDLFIDHSGLVWVGTKFGGLYVHDLNKELFSHVMLYIDEIDELNKENSFVLSFFQDKDEQIWVGTKYGGLLKYNPRKEKFYSNFSYPDIHEKIFASRIECIIQGTFLIFNSPLNNWRG